MATWIEKLSRSIIPPAGKDRFAAKMIRAIAATGSPQALSYDRSAFCLRHSKDGVLNLHNAYNDYCFVPFWHRRDVITRYASLGPIIGEGAVTWPACKSQLLPRVRERFYNEALRLRPEFKNTPLAEIVQSRPLCEDLTYEICVDLPDCIQTVGQKQLKDWNLPFEEALAIARENLWKMSNQNFHQVGGLHISPWQDTHDASRLFLHDLLWQLPVKGAHVAAIPSRDLLLVTGSDDTDGLKAMMKFIDEAMQRPRPMTSRLFLLEGSTWNAFLPASGHPLYEPIRRQHLMALARDYDEQTQLLNQLNEKDHLDCFVARYTLSENQATGQWHSWCVWVKEVTDAMMPQAEYVLFGSTADKNTKLTVRWDDIHRVLAHRMTPMDTYPPRYRITSYPTPEEFAQLPPASMD